MAVRHKLGTLTPVIYFRCPQHHVVLAPFSDCPTPPQCEYVAVSGLRCHHPCDREYADSLPAIDRLQAALTRQENEKYSQEQEIDERQCEAGRQRVRDNLTAKLYSSATPQAEKDFIRAYLDLRNDKRARHQAKWDMYNVYIHAREFEIGNRRPDEERSPL